MAKYVVHPAADVWPMLPDDEMQELAESIKTKGLINPIIVKGKELIDGRNRLAACKIAGVEPVFVELQDDIDPIDFIEVENHNRRHMTRGARAMACIKMRPESLRGKSAKNESQIRDSFLTKTDRNYRHQARTVLAELPMVDVDAVINGAKSLSEAYGEAMKKREINNDPSKLLEALQKRAPDLALRVTEDGMDLGEAIAAADQREANERANRAATFKGVNELVVWIDNARAINKENIESVAGYEEEAKKVLRYSIDDCLKILKTASTVADNAVQLLKGLKNEST